VAARSRSVAAVDSRWSSKSYETEGEAVDWLDCTRQQCGSVQTIVSTKELVYTSVHIRLHLLGFERQLTVRETATWCIECDGCNCSTSHTCETSIRAGALPDSRCSYTNGPSSVSAIAVYVPCSRNTLHKRQVPTCLLTRSFALTLLERHSFSANQSLAGVLIQLIHMFTSCKMVTRNTRCV